MRLARNIRDAARMFEEMEKVPTLDQFRETFEKIRAEEQQHIADKKLSLEVVKTASEDQDTRLSKQDNIVSKQKINKNYESKSKTEIKKSLGFFEVFHEFERCNSRLHDWTESTFKKYKTLRNNLIDMRDYKRNAGLKFFDFTFDYFDEYGLQDFIDFLRDNKNYMNSSVTKNLSLIKVVIRWAYRRGFHNNNKFETFKPKMKTTQKKVVFLTKAELDQIEKAELPETKLYLYRVRDVFLFQCYSGLRYSDVANLKRCDVHDDFFEITTVKTCDSLRIELNKHSKAILDKYKMYDFPKGKALPVISNQRMNEYVHELCKEAKISEPVRQTYYKGNERIDVVRPKHELVGTHTGRRTFICNALGMGIPPQVVMKWTGHNDYKAMKPYIDVADETKAEAMKKFDDF
ncbi:MAG: site-specific integrase [Prevotella sp.]|nr:site-specific integrase [Prevotella sp.]